MTWFFYSLISAFSSAGSALAQKKVLTQIEAHSFCFILSYFNLILSIPFFLQASWGKLYPPIVVLIMIKSLFNALGFWSVMKGIKTLELSRSLPLLTLTPAFVGIGGFFFLGESLTSNDIVGLIQICFGAIILEYRESKIEWKHFTKHGAILLALFFMTINTLIDRYIVGPLKIPAPILMALTQTGFAVFFTFIWVTKSSAKTQEFSYPKTLYFWIFFISILTMSYRFTNLLALAIAPSAAAVIGIKRSSVFFATAFGGKMFKEINYKKRIIAAAMLIIGTIFLFKHSG